MPDGLSPEPRDCPSVLRPHDGRVASLCVCVCVLVGGRFFFFVFHEAVADGSSLWRGCCAPR